MDKHAKAGFAPPLEPLLAQIFGGGGLSLSAEKRTQHKQG
jgi:hypothetical protein